MGTWTSWNTFCSIQTQTSMSRTMMVSLLWQLPWRQGTATLGLYCMPLLPLHVVPLHILPWEVGGLRPQPLGPQHHLVLRKQQQERRPLLRVQLVPHLPWELGENRWISETQDARHRIEAVFSLLSLVKQFISQGSFFTSVDLKLCFEIHGCESIILTFTDWELCYDINSFEYSVLTSKEFDAFFYICGF